jgi:phage shock protein C
VTDQPLEPEEPAPQDTTDDSEPTRVSPPPEQESATPVEPPLDSTPPQPEPKRLTRSSDDRVIAGVCGGLGHYLGIDPVLIRIAALILVFAGGAGILLYAIGWIAMPEEHEAAGARAGGVVTERTTGALLLGLVFVVLGVFFLFDEVWPDFLSWEYVWPVALIAIGAAILLRGQR